MRGVLSIPAPAGAACWASNATAEYGASRYARERDRLRRAVLEDQGWVSHRLWSTDWLQQPERQLEAIAAAMERARVFAAARAATGTPGVPASGPNAGGAAGEAPEDTTLIPQEGPPLATPYVEAAFGVEKEIAPQELPPRAMAAVLLRIVELEGPIHEEELVARVRDLWGKERVGNQIQDAVARSMKSLLVRKRCVRQESCLQLPGAKVPIRDRSQATSAGLRLPRMLPGPEIRAAIMALLRQHHAATAQELAAATARVLGLKVASAPLREAIQAQVERLISDGVLRESEGMLRVAEPSRPAA